MQGLTLDELLVCLLAMGGVIYNATVVIRQEKRSDWFYVGYALVVLIPQIMVILYAFAKMTADAGSWLLG